MTLASGTDPFVGREHELAELTAALDSALQGRGQLVMLVGDPGIGKSRLAEELANLADERGAEVLWGRCPEERPAGDEDPRPDLDSPTFPLPGFEALIARPERSPHRHRTRDSAIGVYVFPNRESRGIPPGRPREEERPARRPAF